MKIGPLIWRSVILSMRQMTGKSYGGSLGGGNWIYVNLIKKKAHKS